MFLLRRFFTRWRPSGDHHCQHPHRRRAGTCHCPRKARAPPSVLCATRSAAARAAARRGSAAVWTGGAAPWLQAASVGGCSILLAAHSPFLANAIFLPPRAAVIVIKAYKSNERDPPSPAPRSHHKRSRTQTRQTNPRTTAAAQAPAAAAVQSRDTAAHCRLVPFRRSDPAGALPARQPLGVRRMTAAGPCPARREYSRTPLPPRPPAVRCTPPAKARPASTEAMGAFCPRAAEAVAECVADAQAAARCST